MANFIIQNFRNLQNVNANNMNTFYLNTGQELVSYFPAMQAICSGIGGAYNNFGQVGTTNVFNFSNGIFRFLDQLTPLSGTQLEQVFALYTGGSKTITVSGSGGTQYIVAQVTLTQLDTFKVETSVNILTTTQNIGAWGSDPTKLALCILSNAGPVYSISFDQYCAHNYLGNDTSLQFPDIVDNSLTGGVTIGGRIAGSAQQLTTSENITTSYVKTSGSGSYTTSEVTTTNGISNNFTRIYNTYSDGGNGVFKPTSIIENSLTSGGYSNKLFCNPNSDGIAYHGFISGIQNNIDTNNYGTIAFSPDASDDSFSIWHLVSSGTLNTGITMQVNGRPELQGTLFGGGSLAVTSESLLCYEDLTNVFTTGNATGTRPVAQFNNSGITTIADFPDSVGVTGSNGHVQLPNGIVIQWVYGLSIPNGSSSQTFPIAFSNNCFSIVISIVDASSSANSVGANVDDATTFTATNSNTGSVQVNYIAIGN